LAAEKNIGSLDHDTLMHQSSSSPQDTPSFRCRITIIIAQNDNQNHESNPKLMGDIRTGLVSSNNEMTFSKGEYFLYFGMGFLVGRGKRDK
jgi:hypothetical protein